MRDKINTSGPSSQSVANKGEAEVLPPGLKWIREVKGRHTGETCFLIGNGWSSTYWNIPAMKDHGILIGCNTAFEKHPLDYLIWQDTGPTPICVKAPCTKFMPIRKRSRVPEGRVDYSTTYFFGYGRYGKCDDNLELGNSGSLALQMAHFMGCATTILVGCDCCLIRDARSGIYRSNAFADKVATRVGSPPKAGYVKRVGDSNTTNALVGFAKLFERFSRRFENEMDVLKLGGFGIVEIPEIDWPDFYSEMHPRYRRHSRDSQHQPAEKQ